MQINHHRKKIMNDDWFKDSYFQDTKLFAELDWKLALFTKLVSGVRLEHICSKLLFFSGRYKTEKCNISCWFYTL